MPDSASATFDLCGAGLSVAAPRQSWIDPFVRLLGPFEAESESPSAFNLVINEDACPEVPSNVPMTWDGEFIEKRAGRIYETDSVEIIEVVGHGHVTIDHAVGNAEAFMKPEAEKAFSFTPLINVLDASLKSAGKNLLHAACLALPDGSGAVVICAPSGFGKTTTSLALARGGYGLVTDDSSVVEPRSDSLAVWGLPRRLKVHHRTAAMMPWIGDLPDEWNEEGEQSVGLDTLQNLISVADPVPVPLRAVVLLGARSEAEHRITLLSKSEALVRLAQDNVSNSITGVKNRNRLHFESLAKMIRAAPVLQLNAGTEVDSLPSTLTAALSRFSAG